MRIGTGLSAYRVARLRVLGVGVVLLLVTLGLVRLVQSAIEPADIQGQTGPVEAPLAADQLNVDPSSFPELVDGPNRPLSVTLPDRDVGTARSWFAFGTWWAVLPDSTTGAHHIWGLGGPDGPWIDTGVLVDDRPFATLEVGWSGEWLVVASTGGKPYRGQALRIHRFSWDPDTRLWVAAPDHPTQATTIGAPDTRMAVTASGEVWLARPVERGVAVAHTEGTSAQLAPWEFPRVDGAEDDVGGFDLVTEGDVVTLVWRSRALDRMVVARRVEGEWGIRSVDTPGVKGTGPVDAAVVPETDGLLALVRTTSDPGSAEEEAADLLLVDLPTRDRTKRPELPAVVAQVRDQLTRPSLVVDGSTARVVAIAPATGQEQSEVFDRGGIAPTVLVEKVAPLDALASSPGITRRLIAGVDGGSLERPLVPAGPVDAESGLVLIVSSERVGRWATLADGVPQPPEVPQSVDGDAPTVLVDDTFDTLPVGGPGPTAWQDIDKQPIGVVADVPTLPGRALLLGPTAAGAAPPEACRTVPKLPGSRLTIDMVVSARGGATSDARLLTVRSSAGSLASVRLTSKGLVGYLVPRDRPTGQAVPAGAALQITMGLDLDRRTTDIRVRTLDDGQLRAEATGIPWLVEGDALIDEVCSRAALGASTSVALDLVRITLES